MKGLHHIVITLAALLALTGCETHVSTDPSLQLSFSQDTLRFDTIFTQLKSTTLTLKIRNLNKEALCISSVNLRDGDYFRINLDGETAVDKMQNITLYGKDSLYLFVTCLPERQNAATPLLIEDAILFSVNEQLQTVWLEAYGQDARICYKDTVLQDTVLTAELPYLIRDTLIFAGNVTVPAGTEFYLHDHAALFFLGNVTMQGTLEQPVRIRGDRLDRASTHILYDYISGRWNGIYLLQPDDAPSCTWQLNYVEMNSGTVGMGL